MVTHSKNFSAKELGCHCCGFCNVNARSLSRLQRMRDLYGRPIHVVSASRCLDHNRDVGGAKNSEHLATETKESTGFDIKINNDRERFELVNLAMIVGFTRIGVKYEHNNIHIGDSQEHDQNIMW